MPPGQHGVPQQEPGNRSQTLNLTNGRLLHSGQQRGGRRGGLYEMSFRTWPSGALAPASSPVGAFSGSSQTMRVESWDRTTTTKGPTSHKVLRTNVGRSQKLCQDHFSPSTLAVPGSERTNQQRLCGETSSDSSYQSLRMLRLLLSAALVQGSDGTVRITVLAPARQPQPGRLVIEPGWKPRSR